jgi:hypothetical protein
MKTYEVCWNNNINEKIYVKENNLRLAAEKFVRITCSSYAYDLTMCHDGGFTFEDVYGRKFFIQESEHKQ